MNHESQKDVPENEKKGKVFRGVIIAAICMVAVGGTLIAMNGDMRFREKAPEAPQYQAEEPSLQDNWDLDVLQPIPTADSREESPPSVPEKPREKPSGEEKPKAEEEGVFYRPVIGTVMKDFSMETPVYSKTLDQYMVHSGVDIEAEADSQVKAVAAGTVVAVFEDDKLGMTVQILHENGLMTQYSNLSSGILAEEGDVVERGQVIGGVGRTALFESLDPAHLHFEVLKEGKPVDPNEYVNF